MQRQANMVGVHINMHTEKKKKKEKKTHNYKRITLCAYELRWKSKNRECTVAYWCDL